MVITYNGGSYLKFQSGDEVILVDPEDQRSFRSSLVAVSTEKPAKTSSLEGGPFCIDNQGEYDVGDIRIEGKTVAHEDGSEKTAYRVNFDEMEIGILGPVKSEPDPKVIELLQDCDILVIPGGEKPFLGAAAAAKIIRQTEPGIIIPTVTKNPKELMRELGQENGARAEEKLTIKKKDIAPKAMKVVWLTA